MKRLISDLDVRIGAWLRDERLARNLAQNDIAEILGLSHQQVQRIEAGLNRMPVSRFFVLADALNIDPRAAMSLILDSPTNTDRLSDCGSPILHQYSRLTVANRKLVLGIAEALAATEAASRPTRQSQASPIEAPAE